jgi:hypothetical protein
VRGKGAPRCAYLPSPNRSINDPLKETNAKADQRKGHNKTHKKRLRGDNTNYIKNHIFAYAPEGTNNIKIHNNTTFPLINNPLKKTNAKTNQRKSHNEAHKKRFAGDNSDYILNHLGSTTPKRTNNR